MLMCSDEVLIGVEVVVIVAHGVANHVIHIHLVTKESTDSTETLHELEAVWRLVSDEFDVDTVTLVVQAEPVGEGLTAYDFEVNSGLGVLEVLRVLLLRRVEQEGLSLVLDWVLDLVAHDLHVLEEHHRVEGTEL